MPNSSQSGIEFSIAFIALGSNLPTKNAEGPTQTIQHSLNRISETIGVCTGKSRIFETPCFPEGAGPDYMNAVMRIETRLSPAALLSALHDIEADFGRERVQRWGQRTLDLDLLAYEDLILPDSDTHAHWRNMSVTRQTQATPDEMILPHPRIQDRAFVLVPWADFAPEWRHPVLDLSVAQMLEALPPAEVDLVRAGAQS